MRAFRFVPFLFLGSVAMGEQPFAPYGEQSEFLLSSPAGMGVGLQGYVNPALLAYVERHETNLAWSAGSAIGKWGLFTGFPHLGFGLIHRDLPGKNLVDYRFALAGGDRRASLGFAYGWSRGNTRHLGRQNHFVAGTLVRPSTYLSAGLTFAATPGFSAREGSLDLALRPLGHERLTLFADGAMTSQELGGNILWSAGAACELLRGVVLSGRYFDNHSVGLGLDLSLGNLGFQTQSRISGDGEPRFSTYALRMGSHEPNFLARRLGSKPQYLNLELLGPTHHRRFVLFDRAHTLSGLLGLIDRAENDPAIGGIALNTSGMKINPVMAWELRARLLEFKQAGKYVVAFLDRVSLSGYHFASVADRIVMDPAGTIALEGFVAGQTYFKGVLEKLGIGFDEWRFFTYKSAFESLSRQDMSAADREQWQALIDDFYRLTRAEICAQRRLDPEEFDRMVDEEALFLPRQALEKGLVDRLGRWDEVKDAIEDLEGGERRLIKPLTYRRPKDKSWGQKPKIAVVYALGVCAMDGGIKARQLAKEIEAVADNSRIKAVVLRVDSPGGDALASDLVAQALKKCKEKKPAIVSQGYVAASGGYWLSMYGDAIVAAPNTITGSIGVIGGWVYNRNLKEKLGVSTDHVQVGAHADLGFGMTVPLLGLQLPDRNLTDAEKQKTEGIIRSLYADFVAKVAAGRGKSPEEIEPLAQGRVWSGKRALEKGLVDRLGGLDTAIQLAKEKAGLNPEAEIRLVELPRPALFDPALLQAGLGFPGYGPLFEFLRFRLDHNGHPLLLMPSTSLDPYSLELRRP